MESLLVGHPLHRIVLSPHLRIRLIGLEQEEVNSLIVGFRTEPELVLDRPKLAMQLHPAYACLLTYLPHCGCNLVLPFLDQPLRQAPHSSLVAGQQQKERVILVPAIDDSPSSSDPHPLSWLNPSPVHASTQHV